MRNLTLSNELPLNDLHMSDLLMQFKVMQALGYHSLFDEDFRREMRNPFRRIIYYKLVSASETMDAVSLGHALKNAADRIGFYSNPELANKIRQQEEMDRLEDADYADEAIMKRVKEFEKAKRLRGEV